MQTEDNKNNPMLENTSATEEKGLDLLMARYHKALWKTIDQLAAGNLTALAKKAGVDVKLITRTMRQKENGLLHWPSLTTLNRLYAAANQPIPFIGQDGKDAIFKSQITPQDQCDAINALMMRHTISPHGLAIQCDLSGNLFEACRQNKGHAYETSAFARPFILFDERTPFLTKKLSEMTDAELEPFQKPEKQKATYIAKAPKPKTEKTEHSPEKTPRENKRPASPVSIKQKKEEIKQEINIPCHKRAGTSWVKEKTQNLMEYYAGDYLVQMRQTTYTLAHEAWRISPPVNDDKEEPGKEALDTLLKHDITDSRLLKLYQFCKFDIVNILGCIKAMEYGLKNRDEIMTAASGIQVARFSAEMLVDSVRQKDPNFAFHPQAA